MDWIYDLNAAVNIVVASLMLAWGVRVWRSGDIPTYVFVGLVVSAIGWIGLYLFVLFSNNDFSSLILGRIFIRPLVTSTLAVATAVLIWVGKK